MSKSILQRVQSLAEAKIGGDVKLAAAVLRSLSSESTAEEKWAFIVGRLKNMTGASAAATLDLCEILIAAPGVSNAVAD